MNTSTALHLVEPEQWDLSVKKKKPGYNKVKQYVHAEDLIVAHGNRISLHESLQEPCALDQIGIKYYPQHCATLNRTILSGVLTKWEVNLLQIIAFKTNHKQLNKQFFWTSVTFLTRIFNLNNRTIMKHITQRGDHSLQDRGWIQLSGRYPTKEENRNNLKAFGLQLTRRSMILLQINNDEIHKIITEKGSKTR